MQVFQEVQVGEALERVTMDIWPTAGQERFFRPDESAVGGGFAPVYFRCTAGAFLAFRLTDAASFQSLPAWLAAFRRHAVQRDKSVDPATLPVLLLALHADAPEAEWAVSRADTQAWAEQQGLRVAFVDNHDGAEVAAAGQALAVAMVGVHWLVPLVGHDDGDGGAQDGERGGWCVVQ